MKKLLITALVAASGWLAALPTQAAPVLSLVPSAASTTVGGNLTVDIVISGLTSTSEIVSGFDLDVFFDPVVLDALSLTTAYAPWGTGSDVFLSQVFVDAGHVEFTLTALSSDAALDSLQGDSFVLSSIGFQGLSNGFSNIRFGTDTDFERNVVGRQSLSLNQTTLGTCVAVGTGSCLAVPEPPMLPLLLLALAASGAVLRRQTLRKGSQR